jgi:hypothetical protein
MTGRMWLRHAASVGLAALVFTVTSCAYSESNYVSRVDITMQPPAATGIPAPAPALNPTFGGTEPGALVGAVEFDELDPQITETGATALKIDYLSRDANSPDPRTVAGAVFIPAGIPPEGGWPILALGHGFTGVYEECAPTNHPNLLGNALVVGAFLLNGYAVTMADYVGLGDGSPFPMLDTRSYGYNIVDSVRAIRNVSDGLSSKWVAFGGSLGGAAVWAANELATDYGRGLNFLGSVSVSPAADMTGLAYAASDMSMSSAQRHLYMLEVLALQRTTQPDIELTDYMRGDAFDNRSVVQACYGSDADRAQEVLDNLDPKDLVPIDQGAVDRLAGWLSELALPSRPLSGPLLLIYASEDDIVDVAWLDKASSAACALGGTIESVVRVGQGHGDLDGSPAVPWVRERFDGFEAPNSCP